MERAAGETLEAKRGEINLVMQANGNLVLRNDEGKVFWSTNTEGKDGYTAIFNEGNLAVYRGGGSIIWETGTGGHPKARLQIHGEGDFARYSNNRSKR